MENQQDWTRYKEAGPAEATRAIEQAFFAALVQRVPQLDDLEAAVRRRIAELEPLLADLVQNTLDAANVRFTLLAVAGFEVSKAVLGDAPAVRALDASLNEPLRKHVLEGTRALLDRAADPYTALVDASKHRELHYFGPSFVFERAADDGYGYLLNVRRCLFHEVLKRCGRVELQPLLCKFDLNWVDAIAPERHHLRFVRPSTFATADVCRMWFMRIETLDRVRLPVLDAPQT